MQPTIIFFLPLIKISAKEDLSFLEIYNFFSRSLQGLLSILLLIYMAEPPLVDSVGVCILSDFHLHHLSILATKTKLSINIDKVIELCAF